MEFDVFRAGLRGQGRLVLEHGIVVFSLQEFEVAETFVGAGDYGAVGGRELNGFLESRGGRCVFGLARYTVPAP